jgi:hypothetical protein
MKGSDLANVIARVEAAGAEPSTEAAGEASQTDGAASAEGSASADAQAQASQPADGAPTDATAPPSPEATTTAPDAAELRAKLQRDRDRRAERERRKKIDDDARAAEAARKEAEAIRDKWAKLGKDGSIIERVKEAGGDPREVFEAMKREALESGTPEALIAKVTKTFEGQIAELKSALQAERDARETERRNAAQQAQEFEFQTDFQKALKVDAFAPLLEEYEPQELYPLVRSLRDDPQLLFETAEGLGVDLGIDLTDPEATFNMGHIFTVMRAQQAAHEAKRQRLKKSAEPHQSQSAQPTEARRPTVNGTEARNAGTTIGNDLAASQGTAKPDYSNESHKERLKRLERMFPGG